MSGPKPIPGLMRITPYQGGEAELEGRTIVAKLSSNECSLGPSPNAIEAYKSMAGELHRYPDGSGANLRQALAEFYDLNLNQIIISNGSDELISQLVHAYCGPGDEIVYSAHGFLMYPIAAMAAGANPIAAPEKDFHTDVDAMLAAITDKTKIVFVANPNNPTGTYLSSEEIQRLHQGVPEDVLLVIDCAYAEYVTRNDYSPGIEMVEAAQNVVMTRTFSKIYGLAALRLGWAYCSPEVAEVYHRVRGPFNVNAAAQAAGIAALRDVQHTDRSRDLNLEWVPKLTTALENLGYGVIPSVGNFITVDVAGPGRTAADAYEFLKQKGIIGRLVAGYGLTNHIRITVGTEEENLAVIAALTELASA